MSSCICMLSSFVCLYVCVFVRLHVEVFVCLHIWGMICLYGFVSTSVLGEVGEIFFSREEEGKETGV